jgi:hypothetical protein
MMTMIEDEIYLDASGREIEITHIMPTNEPINLALGPGAVSNFSKTHVTSSQTIKR